MLFSLLLHNLSGAALKICQNILTGESICCLDSFSAQINTGLSIWCMIAYLHVIIFFFLISKHTYISKGKTPQSI